MASIFYEIKKTIALFLNCNITCLQQSLAYIFSVLQRAGVRHLKDTRTSNASWTRIEISRVSNSNRQWYRHIHVLKSVMKKNKCHITRCAVDVDVPYNFFNT